MMSQAEMQYRSLVRDILDQGYPSRPSKGLCYSVFAKHITIDPREVPLLLGRKMHPKGIVGELRAFLNNADTVRGFEAYGCNFWGAWGNEDGSIDVDYARLLHNFNEVNQLEKVLGSLKNHPDSRKHVISLWDPSSKAKQVPCVLHYQWHVKNGELHMIWSQRSVDVMVGLASDMFSAWLFNHVMADHLKLRPGTVTLQLGDCHIYDEHLVGAQEYLSSHVAGVWLPDWDLDATELKNFKFDLKDYNPMRVIKFELKS